MLSQVKKQLAQASPERIRKIAAEVEIEIISITDDEIKIRLPATGAVITIKRSAP